LSLVLLGFLPLRALPLHRLLAILLA
jgi:hypothetical protein